MRPTVSFVVLLIVATLALGVVWGNFADARAGDAGARAITLLGMPVALLSFALLGRIVSKISAARHAREEG